MDTRLQRVRSDLLYVFDWFPLESLLFLRANRHRLIRHHYTDAQGNGCLFNLLSRAVGAADRIDSRESLTRYFTGGSGVTYRDLPSYQPARWLVRLTDGETVERYGGLNHLHWDFVCAVLEEAIRERLGAAPAMAEEETHVRLAIP